MQHSSAGPMTAADGFVPQTAPRQSRYDMAIVGGGIVGLATARELLLRQPGLRLIVVEKDPAIAMQQSGHNSGVLHTGIYYAPGSLKAKLCVRGARDMYEYCESHGIEARRCGKLIVATREDELPRLEELERRAKANEVPELRRLQAEEIQEVEPHARGVAALHSPATGVVDFRAVARALADDVRQAGGEVRLGYEVAGVDSRNGGVRLRAGSGDEVAAGRAVFCAGPWSDRLALQAGAEADPRIVPFRGDYWVLRPDRRDLARNLIYPVPDPAFPFLGVHLTRRLDDGSVWLGPNAVLAFAREGYRRLDFRPRDLGEALAFRGFQRLATKFWQTGLQEMVRDFSKQAFLKSLQVYVPELTMADLLPGPSGVRAQALAADGSLVDDFVFNTQGNRIVHVRNAPSPGATSSLAIARTIADTAAQAFALG